MSSTSTDTDLTEEVENEFEHFESDDDYSRIPITEPITLNEIREFMRNPTTPGRLQLTRDGEITKQIVEVGDLTGDLREQINHWLSIRLPQQIFYTRIRIARNKYLYFGNKEIGQHTYFDPPRDEGNKLMTPLMAEDKKVTYGVTLKIAPHIFSEVQTADGQTTLQHVESGDPIPIAHIPLMVRANLCYLSGKKGLESIKAGTCPNDYGGYFIIGGSRKVVIGQERLGVNQPFIYTDKDGIDMLRITSATFMGTKVAYFKHVTIKNKEEKSEKTFVGFYTDFLGTESTGKKEKHWINCLIVYKYLYPNITTEQITKHILGFVGEKYRKRVYDELIETLANFVSISDYNTHIIRAMKGKDDPGEIVEKMKKIQKGMNEGFFPHIPEQNRDAKIKLYSLCIARYLERLAGFRELDNRDSWTNKKIDSAAANMEKVFFGTFRKYLIRELDIDLKAANRKKSTESGQTSEQIKELHTISDVLNRIKDKRVFNDISRHMEKIFNGANWGAPDASRKENVAQQLSSINMVDAISHAQRTVTPANKQTKQSGVRGVQGTQAILFDVNETPESEQIGLIKHRTIVCRFSQQTDWNYIYQALTNIQAIHRNRDEINNTLIMIEGIPFGYVNGPVVHQHLLTLRRRLNLPRDVTIIYDTNDEIIYTKSDWGRPIAPFYIVNPNTRKLVMDEKNLWGKDFETILREGGMEYLSSWEIIASYIAQSYKHLNNRQRELEVARLNMQSSEQEIHNKEHEYKQAKDTSMDEYATLEEEYKIAKRNYDYSAELYNKELNRKFFTHVMVSPLAIASISASLIPLFNFVPGARDAYACSHIKQALGLVDSVMLRNDTTVRSMSMAQRPLVTTTMHSTLGLDTLPQGMNIEVYVLAYGGYEIEDAILMNQAFMDRGGFMTTIGKSIPFKTNAANSSGSSRSIEYITKPKQIRDASRYINLDNRGIIRRGSRVRVGDCLIGKTIETYDSGTRATDYQDNSKYAKVNEVGLVDDIIETLTYVEGKGYTGQIIIKLLSSGPPEVGDKFANRNAQKSTIGKVLPQEDLPFDAQTGQYPALIINPASIPKRMTMSMLIEMLMGRYANLMGKDILADAFTEVDIDNITNTLSFYGFHPLGNKQLINPYTGKPMECLVFTGPNYYQITRHLVDSKVQGTGLEGQINATNRQRVGGRSAGGAIRLGEMERDAFLEHGAHGILRDRRKMSDVSEQKYCVKCGDYAIFSPIDDTYNCPVCGENVDASRINMPATFSIICRMLLGANIDARPKIKVNEE